jgi:SAM-dependent methyltransferase
MAEVDLPRLAAAYEHRRGRDAAEGRAHDAAGQAGVGRGDIVIDVGGGRGDHSMVFARLGAVAVVVDPSLDMARHAAAGGVPSVVAPGERLPVADGCASLVYLHLSIHHGVPDAMVSEARRVVRPGGVAWVWTLAREHHRSSFLARWFPSVASIDEARFPDPDDIAAMMGAVGFERVRMGERLEVVARTAASWEAAVHAGFVSTLHLLDPAEVIAGLERFRSEHPEPDAMIEYTLQYRSVWGVGPG